MNSQSTTNQGNDAPKNTTVDGTAAAAHRIAGGRASPPMGSRHTPDAAQNTSTTKGPHVTQKQGSQNGVSSSAVPPSFLKSKVADSSSKCHAVSSEAAGSAPSASNSVKRKAEAMAGDVETVSVPNEMGVDAAHGTSSSSTGPAEIPDDNNGVGPVLPSRRSASTSPRPSESSIFTARKKELHPLSDQLLQACETWLQDNPVVRDDDDEEEEYEAPVAANSNQNEFTGSTNFVPRRGSYRISHEKGALHFAQSLADDIEDIISQAQ